MNLSLSESRHQVSDFNENVVGLSPKQGFVQVWVLAHGVKFQFEMNNFSLMKMERRKTEWLVYHLVWTNWCWEGLGAGGKGDNRGWDGWVASLTRWTWVWVNSWSWWRTGRPGMLRFMGSQRVGHDWATELSWRSKSGHPQCLPHLCISLNQGLSWIDWMWPPPGMFLQSEWITDCIWRTPLLIDH